MFGQQITGQALPSQYGVIVCQSQGIGSEAFLFNVIANIIALFAAIIAWFTSDSMLRRPILHFSGWAMAVAMQILGGMGSVPASTLTTAGKNMLVASTMMFAFSLSLSWAPL